MRAMAKLELTLDGDYDASIDALVLVLSESPKARLQLRHAIAEAITRVVSENGGGDWVYTVATAKARAFVAPGERRKPAKPRRKIEPSKVGE